MDEIKQKLNRLAELDKNREISGSEVHQYQLYPCLLLSNIKKIEEQYQIILPESYRNFLLEIGNGGAGPGYGLLQLKTEALFDEKTKALLQEYERQMLPEKLKDKYNSLNQIFPTKPFPLYQTSKEWQISRESLGKEGEDWEYNSEKLTKGTIKIADYGCGINACLVITGDYRGTIWIDNRCNDGGIYPCDLMSCEFFHSEGEAIDETENLEEMTQPLNFLEWYNHWLDSSLKILLS